MKPLAWSLQVAGLALTVLGVGLLAGPAVAVIAGGAALLLAGLLATA